MCGDAINGVEGIEQRTQPRGAPVLRYRVEERCGLSLTVCGQLDKKSWIHMHRELLRPKMRLQNNFPTLLNLLGEVLGNAVLQLLV